MKTPLDAHFAADRPLVIGKRSFRARSGSAIGIYHQGTTSDVYFLTDLAGTNWVLKRSATPDLSRALELGRRIPHGLSAERHVLTETDVAACEAPLAAYLRGAILMPRAPGVSWGEMAEDIRAGGFEPDKHHRIALCRSLMIQVRKLERLGLAHTDLSYANVFVQKTETHLIDWEDMFVEGMAPPAIPGRGTEGYIAPFVGETDSNWRPLADRFAASILCTEFLLVSKGQESQHDGSFFAQEQLDRGLHGLTGSILVSDPATGAKIAPLLVRALAAERPADVPSPNEWIRVIDELQRGLKVQAVGHPSRRRVFPSGKRASAVGAVSTVLLGGAFAAGRWLRADTIGPSGDLTDAGIRDAAAQVRDAQVGSTETSEAGRLDAGREAGSGSIVDAGRRDRSAQLKFGNVVLLASRLSDQAAAQFVNEFPRGLCASEGPADLVLCMKPVKDAGYSVLLGTPSGLSDFQANALSRCLESELGATEGRRYNKDRDRPAPKPANLYVHHCQTVEPLGAR